MVVENSYGRLKGRWRCLLKRLDFKLKNVPYVVSACVFLHNFCEMHGDTCATEWTVQEMEWTVQEHACISSCTASSNYDGTDGTDGSCTSIRNAFMKYFAQQ